MYIRFCMPTPRTTVIRRGADESAALEIALLLDRRGCRAANDRLVLLSDSPAGFLPGSNTMRA